MAFVRCDARYSPEIKFRLIKKDDQIVGFLIASKKSASNQVKYFCSNLPYALRQNFFKITILPNGKSLMIYDDEAIGKSLIRFPIDNPEELEQLRMVIKAKQENRVHIEKYPSNTEVFGVEVKLFLTR